MKPKKPGYSHVEAKIPEHISPRAVEYGKRPRYILIQIRVGVPQANPEHRFYDNRRQGHTRQIPANAYG